MVYKLTYDFPGGAGGKESTWQCRRCKRHGFNPWVGKIPWRRTWQPPAVSLPRESPWTEEPGGLQSTGSQRVRHDWSDLAHTHDDQSGVRSVKENESPQENQMAIALPKFLFINLPPGLITQFLIFTSSCFLPLILLFTITEPNQWGAWPWSLWDDVL